jgi:hypothetical protein
MDPLLQILGTLGAYFAVMLVLAVAVETILDPLTALLGVLQKKVSPEELTKDLQEWLPDDKAKEKAGVMAIARFMNQYDKTKEKYLKDAAEVKAIAEQTASAFGVQLSNVESQLTAEVTARLYQIRDRYKIDERNRIALLRFISAVVGVLLAWLLQIDSFQLLGDLLVKNAAMFSTPLAHAGGIALSGLAASAGSSFWHDQLGKVRAVKEATQKGQELAAGK